MTKEVGRFVEKKKLRLIMIKKKKKSSFFKSIQLQVALRHFSLVQSGGQTRQPSTDHCKGNKKKGSGHFSSNCTGLCSVQQGPQPRLPNVVPAQAHGYLTISCLLLRSLLPLPLSQRCVGNTLWRLANLSGGAGVGGL